MPKQIRLSGKDEIYVLVDDEDYETLSKLSWSISKKGNRGYACRVIWVKGSSNTNPKYEKIYMHRFIMNAPKGSEVDHINGNRLDNRRCNLRFVDHSQNCQNMHRKMGKSGYRGVRKIGNVYEAKIRKDWKGFILGYYPTPETAARAYDEAAIRLFGPGALTNFEK